MVTGDFFAMLPHERFATFRLKFISVFSECVDNNLGVFAVVFNQLKVAWVTLLLCVPETDDL